MKIIKSGTGKPKASTAGWIGVTVECLACQCRFKLERGDKVGVVAERRPGGANDAVMSCPECDAQNKIDLRKGTTKPYKNSLNSPLLFK